MRGEVYHDCQEDERGKIYSIIALLYTTRSEYNTAWTSNFNKKWENLSLSLSLGRDVHAEFV